MMNSKKSDQKSLKRDRRQSKACTSTTDLEAALAQMQEIEELGRMLEGMPQPTEETDEAVPSYSMSIEEARLVTACNEANSYQAMRWLFNSTHKTLSATTPREETIPLLEGLRTFLMSSKPGTPMESLLVAQAMTTHAMAMKFSEWALASTNVDTSCRFADRAARFLEIACRQAETLQKLRGGTQQRVLVEHLNINGGQAVLGVVNTPGGGGSAQK